MIDLNDLIPPGSPLEIAEAETINERGEIAGNALPLGVAGADLGTLGHAFLLIPICDDGAEGCADAPLDPAVVAESRAKSGVAPKTITAEELATFEQKLLKQRPGFGRFMRASHSPEVKAAVTSAPAVTLSPTALNFGTIAIGSTSAATAVVLKNTGTASLTISRIVISGSNAGDFSQTTTCTTSLSAGASCNISVTFKPTANGTRTAALSISDNAVGSPQRVTLSGIGTTAKLSPASVSFGSVIIGTTSSPKTVTLTNVGTSSLNITGIAITGTDPANFAQTHTCGSSLAAGASCNINVFFHPTASGTSTAVLSISDNGGGSPQSVPLNGTGITCIPRGGFCSGLGPNLCCRAPFPLHAFCSNRSGPGVCFWF